MLNAPAQSTQNTNSSSAILAALSGTPAAKKTDSTVESQDRFLKLLVTQMKNQDPLNPMDNAQITSQMAQLSTVSGIDKMNTTLQALSNSMIGNQTAAMASMIGYGAWIPASVMTLANGQSIGGVELAQPADSVRINIFDESGNAVNTLQLGAQNAGMVSFAWDGQTNMGTTATPGKYRFTAEAVLAGSPVAATQLSFGQVYGVTPSASGTKLDMGALGEFSMAEVRQVVK